MSRRRTQAAGRALTAGSIGLVALALWLAPRPAAGDEPAVSEDCLVCHNNPRFAERGPDGQTRSLYVDPARFFEGAHAETGCLGCHTDLKPGPHGKVEPGEPGGRYKDLLAHRPANERVPAAACMNCHQTEASRYAESIHGTKAAAGSLDTPLCHDCHGHHYVHAAGELEDAIDPADVPATCGSCHGNARLMAQHDVSGAVIATYDTSFHGEKRALGSGRAAVCTSCHGVHDIRALSDPLSSIHPNRRAETCGHCHEGADESFAEGFKHRVIGRKTEPLVYWVQTIYNGIIYFTIGGMVAFIVLDLLRRWLDGRRAGR